MMIPIIWIFLDILSLGAVDHSAQATGSLGQNWTSGYLYITTYVPIIL